MSFTYNSEGIRTSKTVNGVTHTYHLSGSQIVAEEWGNNLSVYIYDSFGAPIGMMYRQTSYAADVFDVFWFEKNLLGDIVAVYNSSGTLVASYTYTDAWGNQVVTYSNGGGSTGAQYNPFRYRGYYYDRDLVMYYLNSRYYDSKICRFINADSALYDATLGYNLFAYCENNPVMKYDTTGEYCVSNMDDDRNLLDDWIFEGAGGGGGGATSNYFGAGTAYNNYSVYSTTSAYNANLGGYYTSPLSSGITNPNYYYVPGAVSVTDSMATDGSSNTMDHSLSFKKEIDLETHFDKHANEFGDLYSTPQEYLNGANYVVNNGTYVPEMNGYVRFFGAKGRANYAFVGLTRDGMYITTFSVRSVVSLYKIPWIMP